MEKASNSMMLREGTPATEGLYQASKWLKVQVLCDAEELAQLFDALRPFYLFPLTGFVTTNAALSEQTFLQEYGSWIEGLKKGKVPTEAQLKRILACALTAHSDALWLQAVPGGRYLVKVSQPVLQLQAHFFTYSSVDGVFRPMSMGANSVFWGIQISYPQIYQDPKTQDLCDAAESPNAELFKKVRQWTRDVTRSTPFIADGKKINVPIRLGRKCFSWIENHPQLSENCYVEEASCLP